MKRHLSKRTAIGAVILAALVAIPVVNTVRTDSASAADALPGDGTTSATAGASCWGIKQQYPSSASGTYWLNTAVLQRPQQFACDMTTDGGGWVLVGRGRNGWSFNPLGQGSAATVRTTTDGTGAFAPAALDTTTVTALLNGTNTSDLVDGIRLERATNSTGTNRQDYRLYPKYKTWTWSFAAGQLLNKVTDGGTTYSGSNTANTANTAFGQTTNGLSGQKGTKQLITTAVTAKNKVQGFGFGSGVSGGSNSSTNFLWTYASEGSPLPFTRVWVRPRVANDAAGFTPLPSTGLPAAPLPAVLKSKSEAAPWGVVGMDHTDEPTIEPYNTNVLAVKTSGDRTFVGGRFTGVQNGPSATTVDQKSLAAFDLDGNWISTFRPKVDGRVWNMAVADGKLFIAGDFTNVNGVANTAGMAALDPNTGEVVTTWKANFARSTGARPLVRGLAVKGSTIYAAGTFNRVTAGTWAQITVTNAISLNTSNGNPGTWRPRPAAQTVDVRPTDDGTRVLMAGYFANVNGDTNQGYFAVTDAATGNPSAGIGPWTPSGGSNAKYQQAVLDLGDGRMVVGGSEHDNQLWNRDRTQLLDATITKAGGDTQALELFDGKIYLGCHCGDWIYQGTNNWSSPEGFRSISAINLVGALDAQTFEYDTTWYPAGLKGAKGEGIWAVDKDSRGCLWVGGDLERGAYSGSADVDWLGGFARFCPADSTPPTAPSGLKSTASGSGIKLDWTGSTDASGTVSYDVYRNDRVIATVWGTSYTDPEVTGTQRYTVRAVDARGNGSAAPAPISVNGPSPKIATAIAFGSPWKYQDSGADLGTAWRDPATSDAAWPSGPGKLGWGTTDLATTFATKPLTAYFRSTFPVADPNAVRLLDLKLKVATGAVVYVNGVEAGRINMLPGAVTSTTPAAGYVSGSAEAAVHTISVPASLLKSGNNTIAVELHAMTAGASRGFFDLEATTYGAGGDTVAPTAPTVSATADAGRVALTWTPGTDEGGTLGGYLITRDGQPLAVTGPLATGYTDAVDTTTAHTYVVTSFDTNGNSQASAPVATTVRANSALLPYGANWKWSFTEAGPAADWAQPGFDDSTWTTGPAELGFGDGDEKTVISTAPAPRPLTAYFRTTVDVPDPAAFTAVLADLIRDDGAVVYVNGVEVGRDNMPAGPVGPSTKAPVAITDRTQEKTPVSLMIPSSAFRPGLNTIAVEIHGNDRYTGDLSFDLKLTGRP